MNLQNVKVYYDGSHYIGIPQGAFPSGKGCKRRVVKSMKQLSTTNKISLETPKGRFETAYKECQSLPKKERKEHIKAALENEFADKAELNAFVEKHSERMETNAIMERHTVFRIISRQAY